MEIKKLDSFVPAPQIPGERPLIPRCVTERNVFWNLLRHLELNGFVPHSYDDGGDDREKIENGSKEDMMAAAFAVDEIVFWVGKPDSRKRYAVCHVCGNTQEGFYDWAAPEDDPEQFAAVMDAIDFYEIT